MAILVRPEQAAVELGITRTAVFRLLAEGRLESLKLGKRRLIPMEALHKLVAAERAAQVEQ